MPGSKFMEYRARATTPASPQVVLRGLWTGLSEPPQGTVRKRELIRKSDSELVFYDQVKTPVVSDRDYTMRIYQSRTKRAASCRCASRPPTSWAPAAAGFVRIPVVRGSWLIEPGMAAAPKLTYQCYSEPGGSIPPSWSGARSRTKWSPTCAASSIVPSAPPAAARSG